MMKFSIRDLLWLTISVGLALALWVERRATITAKNRANTILLMLENLAEVAAWREDWIITTTDSSVEILRPRFGGVHCEWQKSPAEWRRLEAESVTREFSRDSVRKKREAAGIPPGPFPEEVGRDER